MKSLYSTYQTSTLNRLGFLFCVLLLTSCVREVDRFIPEDTVVPGNYEKLLEELDQRTYGATLDLDENKPMQIENMIVSIPEASLVDASGNLVSGLVDVRLTKISFAKDFMAYDMELLDNFGDALDMRFAVKVSFLKDAEPLFFKEDKKATIFVSNENRDTYIAYENKDNDDSWSISDTQFFNDTKEIEINGVRQNVDGVTAIVAEDEWHGLFKKPEQDFKASVCVSLTEGNAENNTTAYFVYKSINALQKVGFSSVSDACNQNAKLIVEYEGTIVVFVDRDNDYFEVGYKNHTVSSDTKVQLTPVKKSAEYIRNVIEGF